MALYNIAYSKLRRRLSELIMRIAMSGTSVNQRENIEQCFIMTQDNIAYHAHYENKAHYLALNLDGFVQ